MTKAELLAEIARLRSQAPRAAESLQHEVDTYAAELEMQNRELRDAQRLLEESRDRYADLYDFAPIGYATLSESGQILDINLAGARLFGRERNRLSGFPLLLFVERTQTAAVLRHLQSTLRAPESLARIELTAVLPDGRRLPIELLSRVGLDGGKKVLRTAVLDLTDRKRADAEHGVRQAEEVRRLQAEEANAIKDTFLATLSHELRTPLNAMQSWLHVLRLKPDDTELRQRGLQVIASNVKQQTQLVSDLLDVARIGRNNFRLDRKRVRLASLVDAVVVDLRVIAQERGIALASRYDADTAEVDGDESRLRQVVTNLVNNALNFTPAEGRVEVWLRFTSPSTSGAPMSVLLSVRDTACGISRDFLPHVFDRFRQADSSTRRRHGGLGLGLSIAQDLVAAHGGTIRADSDGEGKGALFTVELPLAPPQAVAAPAGGRAGELPSDHALDGVQVLAVDDDPTAREIVAMYLERSGATVETATCVGDATQALQAHPVDVVVCDIAMPVADGYDLIHWLRSRPPEHGGRTPAIALTAFASAADRHRALVSGYDAHLAKPCAPEELIVEVQRLVKPAKGHGEAEGEAAN